MNTDLLLTGLGSALVTAAGAFFLWKRINVAAAAASERKQIEVRNLEKQLHLNEARYLEERNRLELQHSEALRSARATAYEEGRQLGLAESQRDHVTELSKQQANFSQQMVLERETAANEAREKLRAEVELQSKLFAVKISPYVCVEKIKGLIKDDEEVSAGYQYQLLVNGIPAFQPHIIVEQKEKSSKVNQENIDKLLAFARDAAQGAVSMYLGQNSQFAKIGPSIFKRLGK